MADIDKKVDEALASNKIPSLNIKVNNNRGLYILVIIVLIGIVLFAGKDPLIDLGTKSEEIIPADVQLYVFNDLVSNESVNVELWIINIGEKTATDIEIFVRVRNHNGTIHYSGNTSLTALLLRKGESCSTTYTIPLDDAEYFSHTIEVSWSDGRKSYSKRTDL